MQLVQACAAALLLLAPQWAKCEAMTRAGQYYFNNVQLSSDGAMSCATCHSTGKALQDGYERALARKHVLIRNTPSLLNTHRHTTYFWDGRAASLEDQVLEPLFSRLELNTSEKHLLAATQACPAALATWRQSALPVTGFVQRALAAYVRSLRAAPSRLELALSGRGELSPSERQGWALFSSTLGCAACHAPPHLTDNLFHDIGLPRRRVVLQTVADRGAPGRYELGFDHGRGDISDRPDDLHKFRTPSLYNVMQTAPYMHNGIFNTLHEVLDFHTRRQVVLGGPAITSDHKQALLALFAAMSEPPAARIEPSRIEPQFSACGP